MIEMELTVEKLVEAPAGRRGRPFRPDPGRPVDLVHLARYTLGNSSHEHEVLALFRRQSGLCLKQLEEAVSDKAWREAARTIKQSARCIGAWRVCETAAVAETLGGIPRATCRGEVVEALAHDIDMVDAFIEQLLTDA